MPCFAELVAGVALMGVSRPRGSRDTYGLVILVNNRRTAAKSQLVAGAACMSKALFRIIIDAVCCSVANPLIYSLEVKGLATKPIKHGSRFEIKTLD